MNRASGGVFEQSGITEIRQNAVALELGYAEASLELGFIYVTKSEFWFNYTPSFFRDFEPIEDTNIDHSFTVGKQLTVLVTSIS